MFFKKKVERTDSRRILLVDDKSFHIISLKDRLKKNYDVCSAGSITEMFETIDGTDIGLVLVDIAMSNIDSNEVIEMLKSEIHDKEIPIVFLTSDKDKSSISKGKKIRAVDFLLKPFSDNELFDCIEYYLSHDKPEEHKPVILAVDDDPETLKSVNWLLISDYKVFTIPPSDKIKDVLKKITPDLFLINCNVESFNGFDLIPTIRRCRFYEHKSTPIVCLTPDSTAANVSKAINLGANDFITKPIDGTLFKDKVAAQLKHYVIMRTLRKLNKKKDD